MEEHVTRYFEIVKDQGTYDIDEWYIERPSHLYYQKFLSRYNFSELMSCMKRLKKKFASKTFQYLITFSVDPEKVDVKDKKKLKKIKMYIISRFKRPAIRAIRADIVEEGGEGTEKQVHWHVALHARTWFLKKSLKYYEEIYGFTDISKSTDNNYDNRLNYINKSDISERFI